MKEIIAVNINEVVSKHKSEHEKYEYYKKDLLPRSHGDKCVVSVYEVSPGKAAYPYHYHTEVEESFLILSGKGRLQTPQGDKEVSQGDFLFFPANEQGAHKLVNTSDTEMLVYVDFDTKSEMNVTIYPESEKIGIYSKDISKVFKLVDEVDYYEDE